MHTVCAYSIYFHSPIFRAMFFTTQMPMGKPINYKNPSSQPGKSQHALIVQHLGLQILSGQIPVDEKLPTEAEVYDQFGVSRTVFREAIRVLNAKGLTYSKPRVGTVVRPREDWHLLDPDILYWLSQSMPGKEFFDTLSIVRRVLEPELAFLAASNATEEDIARIELAYEEMQKATTHVEFVKPDLDFHLAIAKAADNELLFHMFKIFSTPLKQSLEVTSLRPNLHALSLPRHHAILTAIKNKDPISAKHASLIQLEDTVEAYLSLTTATNSQIE